MLWQWGLTGSDILEANIPCIPCTIRLSPFTFPLKANSLFYFGLLGSGMCRRHTLCLHLCLALYAKPSAASVAATIGANLLPCSFCTFPYILLLRCSDLLSGLLLPYTPTPSFLIPFVPLLQLELKHYYGTVLIVLYTAVLT